MLCANGIFSSPSLLVQIVNLLCKLCKYVYIVNDCLVTLLKDYMRMYQNCELEIIMKLAKQTRTTD